MTGPIISCNENTGRLNDRMLQKIRFNDSINEIAFVKVNFREREVEQVLEVFSYDNRSWKEIILNHCIGHIGTIISQVINRVSDLRLCGIDDTLMLESNVVEVLGNASNHYNNDDDDDDDDDDDNNILNALVLRDCELSSHTIQSIGPLFITENGNTISSVDFGGSRFIDNKAISILANNYFNRNTTIQHLNLFGCMLTNADLAILNQNLPISLRELYLGRNQCERGALQSLCDHLLTQPFCQLKILHLYTQQQHVEGEEGQNFLLDISSLTIALETNTSLQKLHLGGNWLSNDNVNRLAASLTQNTTLSSLILAGTKLTNYDLECFAVHLPNMIGLKEIILNGTQQFDKEFCLDVLINGLRMNSELESIVLPFALSSSKSSMLDIYLDLNKGGRRLLQKTNVPRGLWPLVFKRIETIFYYAENNMERIATVINYLLKGPVLMEL